MNKVKWLSATSALILAMGIPGCAQSAPQDAPSSAPTPPPTAAVFRPKVGDARQKPAANADFDGDWSVEWCDKTHPGSDCGGFNITLVQEDDRICGTYSGANAGLSQIDDGSPRAILGAVVRNVAILAISSARSGDIYLVRASVTDDSMQWQVLDTVLNADGDIDVIAYDDTLARQSHGAQPSEHYTAAAKDCAAQASVN